MTTYNLPGNTNTFDATNASEDAIAAGTIAVGAVTVSAGAALMGKVGIDQTTSGVTNQVSIDQTTDGTTNAVHLKAGTAVIGHVINDAGSAIVGKVGIDQTTLGSTNAVQEIAGTTGGALPFTVAAALSNTKTQIKATAGQLYSLDLTNTVATATFVEIFFLPAASVTIGTTVADMHVYLPASGSKSIAFGHGMGTAAGTGITVQASNTITNAGAGTEAVFFNATYK